MTEEEIQCNKFLRVDDYTLTSEILETAEQEIGEKLDIKEKCLQELRQKIAEDVRLFYAACTDEKFLLKFLRVGKFNTKKAFERLKQYYDQRLKHPEIFKNLYPSACSKALDSKVRFVSPYRNWDGSTVVITFSGKWDPNEVSFEESFCFDHLLLDFLTDNPVTQISGITFIVDISGMNFKHLRSLSFHNIKCFVNALQGAFPCRFKALHMVNVSSIFWHMYHVAQPLLSSKLKERVIFHVSDPTWKSLHKYVPPPVLPEEFGGHLGPIKSWTYPREEIKEMEEYFKNQTKRLFGRTL